MKSLTLVGIMGITLFAGRWAGAQPPAAKAGDHAAHHPTKDAAKVGVTPAAGGSKAAHECKPGMDCQMMGQGHGAGMMPGHAATGETQMNNCAAMLGSDGKVEVTKVAKGVTISITSDDPKVIARVQKQAEAMALKPPK